MDLIGNRGRVARRGPFLAVAALAAAIAVAACGSSSNSSSSNAANVGPTSSSGSSSSGGYTLNVGYIGNSGQLTGPEGFAYSKGLLQKWLAADGIKVKLAQFANGPLLTAAMTGGSLDIGILGDTPALIANSHGLPVKIINQDEVGQPAWVIAKKGGATTLAGLSGETVARPQGSYIDRYLQGLLSEKGLTSKVHLTAMLPPQAIAAAENGAIDAVALPAWEVAPIIAAGGTVLAKSETTPDIQGTGVTIATTKVLSAHSDLATDWNAVRLKAIAYATANPAAFYAFQATSNGIKGGPSAAKQFLPLSVYPSANYTAAGLKILQGTLNFLVGEKEATSFSLGGWKAAGT
jgi:sulfonate transport system substrate-binding protein